MHNSHINHEDILTNLRIPRDDLTLGVKLGSGEFGAVYNGQRKLNQMEIAIKMLNISSQINIKTLNEFKKEVLTMAQLAAQCQQLVRLIGVCFEQSPYCIVMELLAKGSLHNLLRNGDLEPAWLNRKETISMTRDIAIGLRFLHKNGVIHRDIKSQNVLLDHNLQVKLSDYGLAKIKKNGISSVKTVETLSWMAPELLSSDEVSYSFASDMYSYGQVLWEITTFMDPKIPFAGTNNVVLLIQKIMNGFFDPVPPNTPEHFEELIKACREINPITRPNATYAIHLLSQAYCATPSSITVTTPGIQELEDEITTSIIDSSSYNSGEMSIIGSNASNPQQSERLLLFSIQSAQPTALSSEYITSPCTFYEISKFLYHVGMGEQEEAEAMLKAKPILATLSGDLIDCAGRKFEKITGFQYSIWALDYHMWTMIKHYLEQIDEEELEKYSAKSIHAQVASLGIGSWVKVHGKQITWQPLINALDSYVKNYEKWDWEQSNNHWCKEVGGAQLLLPAHLINEYNHSESPTYGVDIYLTWDGMDEVKLPRNGGVAGWRTTGEDSLMLGCTFAWLRGGQGSCKVRGGMVSKSAAALDLQTCIELLKARTEQSQGLISILMHQSMIAKPQSKRAAYSDQNVPPKLSYTP